MQAKTEGSEKTHGDIAAIPAVAIGPAVLRSRTRGGCKSILDTWVVDTDQFNVLWPASRKITPKLRAFVDFMAEHLQPQQGLPAALAMPPCFTASWGAALEQACVTSTA